MLWLQIDEGIEMQITQFRSGAELERQIEAGRQLRAETLGAWIVDAVGGGLAVIRRVILVITVGTARKA